MGIAYAGYSVSSSVRNFITYLMMSGSITVVRFAPGVGHDVSIDRSVLPRV